ncbi:hypothetical protein DTO169E5_5025 [Paecilomyces variotii]|nr:hypothetical protein DTO169E5_5025 [Paecilomyces variotii]KAJ9389051.1 hypothetical protein DTO063F5_2211 [Paecilomyces variotii]
MNRFDVSQAPPEYREVEWLSNIFVAGMGIGWIINYVGMVHQSFHDRTYSMAIFPLCCNIAWEIVYGLIYPSNDLIEKGACVTGLAINFAIIYAAVRFAPNEWTHSPLLMRNMPLVFFVGILVCITGHLALAAEIGYPLAISWGAALCQMMLSIGGLCQLLCRNSSRGASYTLWLSRFIGSACVVVFGWLRYFYWYEAFSWLNSPLIWWCLAVFFVVDGSYGVCLYYIKRAESVQRMKHKHI